MTDVHVASLPRPVGRWHNPQDHAHVEERLGRALDAFADAAADLVVVLGDLSDKGDEASLARVLSRLAPLPVPVMVVPGNHDCETRSEALAAALGPHAGDGVATPEGRGAASAGVHLAGVSIASADGGQTAHATAALPVELWPPDDLVILLSHYPLLSRADRLRRAGLAFAGELDDLPATVAPLLARRAPTVVLSGHLHVRDACSTASVLQLCFAALIEHPFEFSLLDVEQRDGQVLVRRTAVSDGGDEPPEVDPTLVPPEQAWTFDGSGWHEAVER